MHAQRGLRELSAGVHPSRVSAGFAISPGWASRGEAQPHWRPLRQGASARAHAEIRVAGDLTVPGRIDWRQVNTPCEGVLSAGERNARRGSGDRQGSHRWP